METDRNTLVHLPEMAITIRREENGDFILTAPTEGEFRTERGETMYAVLGDWVRRQDAWLAQWEKQGRRYPPLERPSEGGCAQCGYSELDHNRVECETYINPEEFKTWQASRGRT